MTQPLKVLFAVAEASPLIKVGGLADVAGALPKALIKLGHDVRVVMPGYTLIDRNKYPASPITHTFSVLMSVFGRRASASLSLVTSPRGVPVYLIENAKYFGRSAVYGEPDDPERFLFLCRALLEVPQKVKWQPDIIHCHDWHTGATVGLMKAVYSADPFYRSCAAVFTIHNLAYQGWFDENFINSVGLAALLPWAENQTKPYLLRMMGLGIYYADVISTVSETYAQEILTPEYGEGLDPLLRQRKDRLYGIVNGLDYEEFNPATDTHLIANYDLTNPEKKALNKAELQKKAGLPVDPNIPLIGMVSRLDEQKGMDILVHALGPLLSEGSFQFVLVGTGREQYHKALKEISAEYPSKVAIFLAFDPGLAQLIYGGSDFFLMPSHFEPCGLGQLIALRYGTIPIVRHTGGLIDTIKDCSPDLSEGNGFAFVPYKPEALLSVVKRALTAFQNKNAWHSLIKRAMSQDFSWDKSAIKYEQLYQTALNFVASKKDSEKVG